ncbi:CDK-activating kinase assembly factor MAT1-domain-containing protein [Peziza echinospora]|nr:CDK-activating kinase assembly factor MAT1-domain-containing protein [Peziza echinospora]
MSRNRNRNTIQSMPVMERRERVDEDEICPVCKSSRYLNPNMRFLINECYHKMCESCVDRIFTLGPAPCPVPNCGKVLRKAKFRKQTFEDIGIEREVDIRKRVAKVFNKRPSDFEDLKHYNDYLEEVETLTFNLISGIDLEETEKKLSAYESLNKSSIAANAALAASESAAFNQNKELERQSYIAAREAAARELEEERKEARETKAAMVRALATAKDGEEAKQIVADTEKKIALKRSSARRKEEEAKLRAAQGMAGIKASLLAGGRRQRVEEEDDTAAFDPLGGIDDKSKYYVVNKTYAIPWLSDLHNRQDILAGGYFVHEYYERCLFEAFSGLTVFQNADPSADIQMAE